MSAEELFGFPVGLIHLVAVSAGAPSFLFLAAYGLWCARSVSAPDPWLVFAACFVLAVSLALFFIPWHPDVLLP